MEPPIPPNEADCCNSGCNPCIFDVYEEQLKKYNASNKTILAPTSKNCISETTYTSFKLIDKIKHTRDTYFLIFEYHKPYRDDVDENDEGILLYYKPGQHFLLRAGLNGSSTNHFTRAYTPIPYNGLNPLSFCVLVRIYEVGMMSRYLRNIRISTETLWRGPYCNFQINYKYQQILMVAQGTGIAPLYAVIKEMLKEDECDTFIKLYFCCRSCDDILLRDELYQCLSYWNFKYEIFLSVVDDVKIKYNEVIHNRKLNLDDIESYLEGKRGNGMTQVLICGSSGFSKDLSEGLNRYDQVDIFIF